MSEVFVSVLRQQLEATSGASVANADIMSGSALPILSLLFFDGKTALVGASYGVRTGLLLIRRICH